MAAEGMPFPWRLNRRTISANTELIWEMSVDSKPGKCIGFANGGKVVANHDDGQPAVAASIGVAGLFAAVILSMAAASAQDDGTAKAEPVPREVIAGVPESWPPQYDVDEDGRPVGFAIDVMDAVTALAGIRVTYRVFPNFAEAGRAMDSGTVDIIPNSGITPDRVAAFAFTAPVETFVVSIFVRDDTQDIGGLADLVGRRVAVVERNIGEKLLKDRTDIQAVVHPDIRTALFDLLSGHADAIIFPQPVLLHMARKVGLEERIKVVGAPLIELKRGIRLHKYDTELLAVLNAAVERFVRSPAYRRIYVKWYGTPKSFWTASRVAWAMGGIQDVSLLIPK